jgi:hypothetical protein
MYTKYWIMIILMMLLVLPQVVAQAKYKHLPRVKIEKTKPAENINIPVITERSTGEVSPIPASSEVASTQENLVVVAEKKAIPTKIRTVQKIKKVEKVNKDGFSESVKQKSYLLDVKEVAKTQLLGYILWFIIVLLLGIALLVLAFIFLWAIAYSLWYIFLVFGAVGLAIALLILIFGLTGLI